MWERWLARDPVRLAAAHGDALRRARAIWIDAAATTSTTSTSPRSPSATPCCAAGVDEDVVRFELHEGTHRGTNWRHGLSIPFLAERLAP